MKSIDKFIDILGFFAGVLLIALSILVICDVAARYFRLFSMPWSLDFAQYGLYLITFFGTPWVLRTNGHITIDLLISKLNYENIIGKIDNPKSLKKNSNSIVSIPKSLDEAINLSKQNNPDIKIANFDLVQSEKDLAIAESDLKPTASLSLEKSFADDLSSTIDRKDKDILKATVSWPFYSGGKNKSKINKNTNLTVRKRLLLDDVIRTNDTNVASAWSSLASSKSFLNSVKVQVRAAKIANEGIAAEYERGSRTTLDVIQSNSLLLSAQISLANSERNYLMAQYNLLKSVGLLNSQYLKLK